MTSWFRSWHGAPTDNKWLLIARRSGVKPGIVSAVAWALFDYASQTDERGSVKGFDVETYAAFSGFDENEIRAVIIALHEKGIITPDCRLASWEQRQPKREENSTERVRAYRNKQAATADNATHSNAPQRDVTHGNAPDTDTETDTELSSSGGYAGQPAETATNAKMPKPKNTPADYQQVVRAYENEIGLTTPIISDAIKSQLLVVPAAWAIKAIGIAAKNGKRNWAYAEKILDRWTVEGFDGNRDTVDKRPSKQALRKFNSSTPLSKVERSMQAIDEVEEMLRKGGTL